MIKRWYETRILPGLLNSLMKSPDMTEIRRRWVPEASGESIPADNNQFDSAVITWTMCTIPNPHSALMEIKRVLKPGGRVYFAEHGLSPDAGVAKWQHRINGIWKPLAGGCNLNRRPDQMLAEAGFTIDHMETGHIQGPKFATYTYQGFATV